MRIHNTVTTSAAALAVAAALVPHPVLAQATKAPAAKKAGAAAKPKPAPSLRQRIFNIVWNRVNEGYYDTHFNGVDWRAVRRRYEPLALQAKTDAQFYQTLNSMLGELKQSHLGVIPPEEVIGDAETPAGGDGDTGLTALLVDGQAVVTRVVPDSPAAKAGIRPGYVLNAIGERSIAGVIEKIQKRKKQSGEARVEVWSAVRHLLAGPVGEAVSVTVLDAEGKEQVLSLTRAAAPGKPTIFGALPPIATEIETRSLENGIGYIRFNIWLMPVLQPIRDAVQKMAAEGAPGIILDLRGNVGGMGMIAPAVAGTFSPKQGNLGTMRMRDTTMRFPIRPQPPRYAGPVVVLTDEASLSTSEILAGGLQEMGRAVVIGRPTGGMVLPSQIVELPGGARLQYVFADFRTPKGVLLEGRGVTPDVPVTLSRETLLAHPDPVLDAALDYIKNKQAEKKVVSFK